MYDVIYGFSHGNAAANSAVEILLPNGNVVSVPADAIVRRHPISSIKDGMIAFFIKRGAPVSLMTESGSDAFAVHVNSGTSSFPKYYDDDGGTPLKSYDDPISPRFHPEGSTRKGRDDAVNWPHW